MFSAQISLAGRIVLRPDQIRNLLYRAPDHVRERDHPGPGRGRARRRDPSVNGALAQTKRVLDVEGYEVLRVQAAWYGSMWHC